MKTIPKSGLKASKLIFKMEHYQAPARIFSEEDAKELLRIAKDYKRIADLGCCECGGLKK